MSTIRLVLVDDHDVVRTGLKAYLNTQEEMEVVAEANSGEAGLRVIQDECPDVVVMDISMPGMNGLEATRRIKVLCPQCKILALTVHDDKQYFFEMLAAGADGYITKQAAADELVRAIRALAIGNIYLQPALASWLLEDYRRLLTQSPSQAGYRAGDQEKAGKDLDMLSKRELQVLEGVARGFTNAEVGELLKISPKTVARHRERIMSKLNLHSCAELVHFAIRTGLVKL